MIHSTPNMLFDIEASIRIDAAPGDVYRVATDVTRMGEWSPENQGGEWIQGEPGARGSRFRGHNAIGQATWSNECEVVASEPGKRFAWTVLQDGASNDDNLVWSFDVEPDGAGSRLIQRFRLREAPTRLLKFKAEAPAEREATFFDDRAAMLEKAMHKTIEGIKESVEP